MRINQNVLSIQTHSTLARTNARLEKSIEKLSSGLRINRAADDAAGLAISEKLRRQIRGLSRAISNSQDGISMIQTAEGAMGETHSILQRMRELAIQAANDTLTSNDRMEIQKEVNQLKDDINRISRNTEFNTKKLLDGSQTALISGSSNFTKGIVTGDLADARGDYDVSIVLEQGGVSQMQRTQTFTILPSEGDPTTLAKGSDQLSDIAQFYDANGTFVLQSPQTILLQGNGKNTSFVIDGHTTLDQLSASLQNALSTSSGLDIAGSKASYIGSNLSGTSNGGGYIEMASGTTGEDGDVAILADQPLLNALGLSTVRESANNQYKLQIANAGGYGAITRTDTNRAVGLLEGIDVTFQSEAAQIAGYGGVVDGLYFSAAEELYISVAGTTIPISIRATVSGGWTMEGLARFINNRISVAAVSGASAAVIDNQIRFMFNPPSNYTGSSKIVTHTSGNNTLGINNGTYSGYVQSNKNEAKSMKLVSMYYSALASQTVAITLSAGDAAEVVTLFETISTATLADGIMFNIMQTNINYQLKSAAVAARVDIVDYTMVFSSTRVGRVNDATVKSSTLTLFAHDGITSATSTPAASFLKSWGFTNISGITPMVDKGKGDSTFRLHVVNNDPQFQIGADQGQFMKIGIADMSAESLGVDNLNMTTIAGANSSLSKLNNAIDKVSSERSKLGAFQNRLEYAISNLRNTHSNLTASESRIRDADIAQEMIEFTRNQIVAQSGTAMLAQANTVPQSVLQLLK
ncbi:MAG: hypothetical protein HQM10_21420 [Candidatus Riflebacteria bacterium]|nr:hypothetical protein [Candidatus Riflebacteria bacterium]